MNNEHYMLRAVELARLGFGQTSPNPSVGAVVVDQTTGRIIGEGWHRRYGEPHAEVNAIASVENKELLCNSTIYVTLEPCSHWGKTPPCADLIIEKKIPRVVIGTVDPNDKVCGEGIRRMRAAGIEVTIGVLEKECQELNAPFFTSISQNRPYILLKWAETADGFIDIVRDTTIPPVWFTGSLNQLVVHRLRARFDAIAVGRHTALLDNPSLTVRNYFGTNPTRVTFDKNLTLPTSLKIFDSQTQTILFTSQENYQNAQSKFALKPSIKIEVLDYSIPTPPQIIEKLHTHRIQSIIIEGGTNLLQSFIDYNLYDNILVFKSQRTIAQIHNKTCPQTIKAPTIKKQQNIILSEKISDCIVQLS